MKGNLYIVATPIGNLKDITIRALEILKKSDYILAESSARTSKLLNEYSIKKKIITFNKDNEKRKKNSIIKNLCEGLEISLVSDAGTPSISDPGFELIKSNQGRFHVIPIPGPSSLTSALSVSEIPINNFVFLGFLSKKTGELKQQIISLKNMGKPGIIFESKYRVIRVIKEIIRIMGGDTKIGVFREITKLHEEIFFNSADKVLLSLQNNVVSGEITLIIGTPIKTTDNPDELREKVLKLLQNYTQKETVDILMLFTDINKKDLYKYVLSVRQEE